MDEPISKDCSGGELSGNDGGSVAHASLAAEPDEGAIIHQIVCFCSHFSSQYRNLRHCSIHSLVILCRASISRTRR
jgi:hypothetical protein